GKATTIVELNGVMQTVMKSALERMLGAELSVHLSEQPAAAKGATMALPSRPPKALAAAWERELNCQTSGRPRRPSPAWGLAVL
ncbi:MAG: hypothetical protein IT427_18710, partial [Pirellulales bacterium]|nr:hypothetical protein [Pirellulales bacterium]